MLNDKKLMAFVCTGDADRARGFYRDVLGLELKEEHAFALVFDANGTELRVAKVAALQPAQHTVLGWQVPDIEATIGEMEKAGVRLNRYEGIGQDERGIWTAPAHGIM